MGSVLACFEVDVDTRIRTSVMTSSAVAGVMVEAHAAYSEIHPPSAPVESRLVNISHGR